MKHLTAIFVFSFLLQSQAFAGAFDLYCANQDKTVELNKGSIRLVQNNGSVIEGIYYSTAPSELMGLDVQVFFQTPGEKFVIAGGVPQITRSKAFKDECGNVGMKRTFRESIKVLDINGNEVKQANIICTDSIIAGHCL